jgi:hypothetical protein
MSALIFNGLCAQKFHVMQIFPQLQKPVRTKLSERKIMNLKLFFVNTVILIAIRIKIVCFSETEN